MGISVSCHHMMLLGANRDVRTSGPSKGGIAVFKPQSIGMENWRNGQMNRRIKFYYNIVIQGCLLKTIISKALELA